MQREAQKGVINMLVRVKDEETVEISGYVNAIERNSKTLKDRIGSFVERICKGAFSKALKRNDDVHILLNHDWKRDLGSTKKGNLELKEDNIGLKAKAVIEDPDIVKKARQGDLIGWSIGFRDRDVDRYLENGLTHRAVKDLDLYEVSILDRTRSPAYEGTLITVRDNEEILIGDNFIDSIELREETANTEQESNKSQEINLEEPTPKPEETPKPIDYSKYEYMIKQMKEA